MDQQLAKLSAALFNADPRVALAMRQVYEAAGQPELSDEPPEGWDAPTPGEVIPAMPSDWGKSEQGGPQCSRAMKRS